MNLNYIIYKNKSKKWYKLLKKEFISIVKKKKKSIKILNSLSKKQNN